MQHISSFLPCSTRLCLAFLASLLATSVAFAAKPLPAPTDVMLRGHNQLALVQVQAKPAADKLRVTALEQLHGETPAELEVRGDAQVFANLKIGQKVILSYSTLRKNPLLRDVREIDPEGAKATTLVLLRSVVLGDSPDLRILLERPGKEAKEGAHQELARRHLKALLRELNHPTAANRRLAVAEFFTRSDLRELIESRHHRQLAQALDNQDLALDAKDFLLRGVLLLPVAKRGSWLAKASRRIIDTTEPQLDLTTSAPALAQAAAWALRDGGKRRDAQRLDKLLYSNNPGVAKAALEAMDQLDPERALEGVQRALKSDDLQAEARRVLGIYAEQSSGE